MDESLALADNLYRLGGGVELDGRVAAFPRGTTGYAPSNCYLLTTGDTALLVDTGYTVHRELLLRQLRALFGDRSSLSLFFTRPSDFESISNAGAVLAEFPVDRVYSRIPGRTIVGFPPGFPPQPEGAEASWPPSEIEWLNFPPGVAIEVAPGERPVEPITAPLRKTGSTSWLYDDATRTLFAGDCFGHVVRADSREAPAVRSGDPDPTTAGEVRERLLGTFDWLERADTTAQCDAVADFFATRAIEVIAPGHGCVLVGRDVVERHVELLLAVLGEFRAAEVGSA